MEYKEVVEEMKAKLFELDIRLMEVEYKLEMPTPHINIFPKQTEMTREKMNEIVDFIVQEPVIEIEFDEVVCNKGYLKALKESNDELEKENDELSTNNIKLAYSVDQLRSISNSLQLKVKELEKAKSSINHDGCINCKHQGKSAIEKPCSICKSNYKDRFELVR